MGRETKKSDNQKRQERLALLGLAAEWSEPSAPCPDDDGFAAFLEADPDSAAHKQFVNHLSTCDSCFQKWLIVSAELDLAAKNNKAAASRFGRQRLLTAVGSACALAVGVMLYLSIDYQSVLQEEVADSVLVTKKATIPSDLETDPETETAKVLDNDLKIAQKPKLSLAEKNDVFEIKSEERTLQSMTKTDKLAGQMGKAPAPAAKSLAVKREQTTATGPTGSSYKQPPAADEAELMTGQPQPEGKKVVVAEKDVTSSIDGAIDDGLSSYIDLILDLCADENATEIRIPAESVEQFARQGRQLLDLLDLPDSGMAAGIRNREFIKEVVELLEKEPFFDDNEFDLLCERVEKFTSDNGYKQQNQQ